MSTENNACMIFLNPNGDGDFNINYLTNGNEDKSFIYLVLVNKSKLQETITEENLNGDDGVYSDEEYLNNFEDLLRENKFEFVRLPSNSFGFYSQKWIGDGLNEF